MKVAHILVCHSYNPKPLFDSIPHNPESSWHIFLHSKNLEVEKAVSAIGYERNAQVYFYGTNRGLAKSWNEGIYDGFSKGADVVMLLNDDITFYEHKYAEFVRVVDIVSRNGDISHITPLGFEPHMASRTIAQDFACCAISKSCIDKVGYFDENFFPAYCEDVDFFIRSTRLGLHAHVETRTMVEHARGGTSALFSEDEQRKFLIEKRACEDYFAQKWGVNPYFSKPFGDSALSLTIPYLSREAPYGTPYDRVR